jgi:uncharacterized membrane protein YoaK (UPF0700 family)
VGGYVDTTGYLMLRGLFPNHVTGNLPIAAAHPGRQVIPALVLVPLWFVAVVLAAGAAGRIEPRRPGFVLPALLGAEAALLGLFLVCGVALIPDVHSVTLVDQGLVAGAGVCAMATQSVVSRLGGYAYPTTMVTGTLTLLGMDSAQALFRRHPPEARAAVLGRVKALARVVLAFATGAGVSALVTNRVHFWAIALPFLAVVLCARRELAVPGPERVAVTGPDRPRRPVQQRFPH